MHFFYPGVGLFTVSRTPDQHPIGRHRAGGNRVGWHSGSKPRQNHDHRFAAALDQRASLEHRQRHHQAVKGEGDLCLRHMGQPFRANTFAVAGLLAAWHSRVRGTGSAGECRRGLLPVIPGVCRNTLLLLGMELPVARIPVSRVAPLSLLIPVFGIASSALIVDEVPSGWEWLCIA